MKEQIIIRLEREHERKSVPLSISVNLYYLISIQHRHYALCPDHRSFVTSFCADNVVIFVLIQIVPWVPRSYVRILVVVFWHVCRSPIDTKCDSLELKELGGPLCARLPSLFMARSLGLFKLCLFFCCCQLVLSLDGLAHLPPQPGGLPLALLLQWHREPLQSGRLHLIGDLQIQVVRTIVRGIPSQFTISCCLKSRNILSNIIHNCESEQFRKAFLIVLINKCCEDKIYFRCILNGCCKTQVAEKHLKICLFSIDTSDVRVLL